MKLDGKLIQQAIMQLVEDYKFDPVQVLEIMKMGIKSAFKKDFVKDKKAQIQVAIDAQGAIRVFREYDVVEVVEQPEYEMQFKDAKKIRSDAKVGEKLLIDITPEQLEFSRIAVQAAAQTIKQSLKSIERENFFQKFQNKQGELLKAKVIRIHGDSIVLDVDGTTVVLGPEGQIPNRIYNLGEEIYVLLRQISKGTAGIVLDITQSSQDFIEAVIRKIVPELEQDLVIVKKIVRVPGKRSKVLVEAEDEKIDPVGVMVGQKGDRINSILSLLDWEKIDFIEYTEDTHKLLADCLKPARVKSIDINGKKAIVQVDEDQKALAIGKWAVNIKLAGQVTWLIIEIK